MKKHLFAPVTACVLLLLTACSSTEPPPEAKKETKPKEDPVITKAKAEWRSFVEKKELEDRKRQDTTRLQNNDFQVFPWRDGSERRSEKLYEKKEKSLFAF